MTDRPHATVRHQPPAPPTVVLHATARQAALSLASIADDHDDHYTYPHPDGACLYLCSGDNDTGGAPCGRPHRCLIGELLARWGVPDDVLSTLDQRSDVDGDPQSMSVHLHARDGRIDADPDVVAVLRAAQTAQDAGETWHDAAAAAFRLAERLGQVPA